MISMNVEEIEHFVNHPEEGNMLDLMEESKAPEAGKAVIPLGTNSIEESEI